MYMKLLSLLEADMWNDSVTKLGSQSIYQIFPRNFTAEGTLDAASAELSRIAGMGFDIVYLTPVHPIGKLARKGPVGSPYAIVDYRSVDPALGGEAALQRFCGTAHQQGLKVIMDVVYNHTSPDSLLVQEHPDWFITGPDGKPGRKVDDWSDVIDLDYSAAGLREYLIETLEKWLRLGADGFRCDVASLVPVDFWVEARRRAEAIKPTIWLAESVHKEFVSYMRHHGHYAASDSELHAAFDLTYDYDGREFLDGFIRGSASIQPYLDFIELQSCMYPAHARKARCLENHDQPRIADLVPQVDRLRNITAMWMLLPGTFFAYMGQEWGLTHKPDLFSNDPLNRSKIDNDFLAFFSRMHALGKQLRSLTTRFLLRQPALGVVLMEGYTAERPVFSALFNLDGRRGQLDTEKFGLSSLSGQNLLTGEDFVVGDCLTLGAEPLVLAVAGVADKNSTGK
ncbi:MAG: alpha-amylase [Spirochaetes bacterium]|nr:alpha-amylase [Spirochaetota bacterium]